MAKNKRKPSAAQRDKHNIAVAKMLKESGILSKQTNLHSGNYISRDVLAKVKKYEDYARLNYGTVKVKNDVAKAAKERGYQVVQGNRIVGPKTQQFRNRLKKGEVTGLKPVKGGYMEEVYLPHSVYDMQTLVDQLEKGIDTFKLPDEQFAFKYKGNESYRAFRDTQTMLEYLTHYKGIRDLGAGVRPEDLQEEFDALTIFRLHPNATTLNIPSNSERKRRAIERRAEKIRNGEYVYRKRELTPYQLDRRNKKDQEKRRKIARDPVALAEYREKARIRAKKSREAKK